MKFREEVEVCTQLTKLTNVRQSPDHISFSPPISRNLHMNVRVCTRKTIMAN